MEFQSYSLAFNFVARQNNPDDWKIVQECGINNKVSWLAIDEHRFDISATQSEKG